MERRSPTVEEGFEDVGLDDQKQHQQMPKKRGFFSKFSDAQERDSTPSQPMSRFLLPSRKRAQSGQGAELNSIDSPRVLVTNEDDK